MIVAGPWGAIGPEDEPNLILRYIADDPDAVAEVRSRHMLGRYMHQQQERNLGAIKLALEAPAQAPIAR